MARNFAVVYLEQAVARAPPAERFAEASLPACLNACLNALVLSPIGVCYRAAAAANACPLDAICWMF
jgi:hypothetical protein